MINIKYGFIALILITIFSGCKKDRPVEPKSFKASYINGSMDVFPHLIWSTSDQPDPLLIRPAIFYSPHQDDETIGMGASIAEHVRSGRPVYLVLLTNGANLAMLGFLREKYNQNATMEDLTRARNNEMIAACMALGIHRVYVAYGGRGYDDQAIGDVGSPGWITTKNEFKNTMLYFAKLFPNASQKTVSGNCDSYNANCDKMPAHQAAATAMHELYNTGAILDARLYRVYCYFWHYGSCDRCSSYFYEVSEADKITKQKAIAAYKYIDQDNQRYGLAYYYSAMGLFKGCWDSNYEYVDFIENDY
jgi:LmbE family N-acetylglucosaminyl deacetylase